MAADGLVQATDARGAPVGQGDDLARKVASRKLVGKGLGAHRLSARDLRTEIEHTNGQIRENYLEKEQKTKSYLLENASGELGDFLKELEEERKKESKKSKGKA